MSLSLSSLDWTHVVGSSTYADHGYPHEAWRLLRREDPIRWFDLEGGVGFWAITKRADIVEVSKQPEIYRNSPRLAIFEGGAPIPEGERTFLRQLLNMDPPEHGHYRGAASGWFTPRSIERRRAEVERITNDLLEEMAGDGEEREGDFVADLTAPLTLNVLAEMLGVPREDWKLMFDWTNRIAGAEDPEFGGGDSQTSFEGARNGLFQYFAKLAEERKASPRDDMVSVLVHAKVDGKPMPPLELLSYYFLLVVAGNETTRNAASGGLLALIENPGEMEKLRADPALVNSAVEEIVRWTTPVIQFCRTPNRDVELRGVKIPAHDSMCLFYASANRDEEVFEDPDVFRVDRKPNPHVGFGIGEHFCLGANLARLELRVIFRALADRLEQIELAGPVERMRSSFLGGVKRMPIRYRLRPR